MRDREKVLVGRSLKLAGVLTVVVMAFAATAAVSFAAEPGGGPGGPGGGPQCGPPPGGPGGPGPPPGPGGPFPPGGAPPPGGFPPPPPPDGGAGPASYVRADEPPPPGGEQPPPGGPPPPGAPPTGGPQPPQGGGGPIGDPNKQCGVPQGGFHPGFFNRVHKLVVVDVDIVPINGRQYIGATITKMPVPAKFEDQTEGLVDQLAYFKFRLSQIDDKHGDSVSKGELAQADQMKLRAKFIRPDKWVSEEDDMPSPTFLLRGGDIVKG